LDANEEKITKQLKQADQDQAEKELNKLNGNKAP
jgi:hypothetical protein